MTAPSCKSRPTTRPGRAFSFRSVATLEHGDRLPVYESLLQANLFWSGPDGATLERGTANGKRISGPAVPQQVIDLPTFETLMEICQDRGILNGRAGAARSAVRRPDELGAPGNPA